MTLDELYPISEYKDFRASSLDYLKPLLKDCEYAQWLDFYAGLDRLALTELSLQERLSLAKTALSGMTHGVAHNALNELRDAAVQLKKSFGTGFYHPLFNAYSDKRPLQRLVLFCSLAESLKETKEITAIKPERLEASLGQLQAILEKELRERFPERPIAEIAADFRRIDHVVRYPLEDAELGALLAEYEEIAPLKFTMAQKTLTQLTTHLHHYATCFKTNPCDRTAKIQVIAGLRDMIRRHFAIQPHDTQIITLLAILNNPSTMKGRIAQVKTGEGKSTIIALLAAFSALQGHFVDVISSNQYLATRDRIKYQSFFAAMDISASDICCRFPSKEDFRGQVVYATATDIRFSLLREALYNNQSRYSLRGGALEKRGLEVIIIDEVDNLLVDARNSARIAIPANEDYRWLYEALLHYAKDPVYAKNPAMVLAALSRYGSSEGFKARARLLSVKQVSRWLTSAAQALAYEKDTDYIIETTRVATERGYEDKPQVVIIDKDTGRKMEGCRWSRGVHEFVELHNGITPSKESYTAASISNSFFKKYQRIYGLTGTMGGEAIRAEVGETYGLGSFDVPPRIPSKRVNHGLHIVDAPKHYDALYSVLSRRTEGREACLVLFNTIADSIRFSEFLRSKGLAHQLLNEQQEKHEEVVVAGAGDPGSCTIATNVAGRGTDIPVRACNFHVLFAQLPQNDRVRDQGYGRTARQGKPGSCETLLSATDRDLLTLFSPDALASHRKDLGDAELEALINEAIAQKTAQQSKKRAHHHLIESLGHEKQDYFFALLARIEGELASEGLRVHLVKHCADFTGEAGGGGLVLDPTWQPLIDYAQALIKQKALFKVDWTAFLEAYRKQLVKNLSLTWAMFYTDLADNYDLELEEARVKIEEQFAHIRAQLEAFTPTRVLAQVLSDAAKVDKGESARPTPSAATSPSAFFASDGLSALKTRFFNATILGRDADLLDILCKNPDWDLDMLEGSSNPIVSGKTALQLAVFYGKATTAQILLTAGASHELLDAGALKAASGLGLKI